MKHVINTHLIQRITVGTCYARNGNAHRPTEKYEWNVYEVQDDKSLKFLLSTKSHSAASGVVRELGGTSFSVHPTQDLSARILPMVKPS